MAVLGVLELNSIARGIVALDAAVKAAPVEILRTHPIDPGKYILAITGDVASVQASVRAGSTEAGDDHVVDSFTLPNVHDQVLSAIQGPPSKAPCDAIGVIETTDAASIVQAADAACKAAKVSLVTLHIALRIGGKGYTVVAGDVSEVEAAVAAGVAAADSFHLQSVVIPNPYPETYERVCNPDPGWHEGAGG